MQDIWRRSNPQVEEQRHGDDNDDDDDEDKNKDDDKNDDDDANKDKLVTGGDSRGSDVGYNSSSKH